MTIQANFPNVLPSLLLDFANAKKLDPRVTFTRATTATYYDDNTTAMAEQNVLLYSQAFANGAWGTTNATKTSTTVTDPAGGSTGLTLTKTSADDYSLRQSGIAPAANTTYTVSAYLKGNAGDTVTFYMDNGTNQSFSSTITLTASWTRYTITNTFNSTVASVTCGVAFRTANTATAVDVAFFQLEQRSSATAYTPTTTQPITNYIPVLMTAGGGQPRFDHNPTTRESLGLLVEEQRTNSVSYSATFDTWGSINSQSGGRTIVPDGTVSGVNANRTGPNNLYTILSASASTTYTFSVYAKAGFGSIVNFGVESGFGSYAVVGFNLSSGIAPSPPSGTTVSMTAVGNGWYRLTMTGTTTGATSSVTLHIAATTADYTNGVWVWGAQLEAGAFATSYIPTAAAAATRAADTAVMTGNNLTSWFNAGQGTFYGDGNLSGGGRYFHTVKLGSSAQIEGVQQTSTFDAFIYTDTVQANINISANSFANHRVALRYQTNGVGACVDAGSVSEDNTAVMPLDLNAFYVNSYGSSGPLGSGTVKKVAYYPIALTNAQLQALTS